jgi:hypothetical protein
MEIKKIASPNLRQIWDRLLKEKNTYTFFHTPRWLAILLKSDPRLSDESIYCRFPSGNRCILPLTSTPLLGGLFKALQSLGPGSYSNFIGTVSGPEKNQLIRYLLRQPGVLRFTFANNPLQVEKLTLPGIREITVTTHLLHLEKSSEHIFENIYSGNMRSKVRRSRKKGLQFKITRLTEALDDFYSLYVQSVQRWGERLTRERPYEFFQTLAALGGRGVGAAVVTAGGQAVSAAIYYLHDTHVYYAFGAFDHSRRHLYPNVFLHDRAIGYFHHQRYRCFDMGPDAGLTGVAAYKNTFGGENFHFPAYTWTIQDNRTSSRKMEADFLNQTI